MVHAGFWRGAHPTRERCREGPGHAGLAVNPGYGLPAGAGSGAAGGTGFRPVTTVVCGSDTVSVTLKEADGFAGVIYLR